MLDCPLPKDSPAKLKASQHNSNLRIAKIKPAGDVLHVFSHIRKTYRTQWVLLEGTSVGDEEVCGIEEPPRLKTDYVPPSAKEGASTKAKKAKKTSASVKSEKNVKTNLYLRWVKYDDVQNEKYVTCMSYANNR